MRRQSSQTGENYKHINKFWPWTDVTAELMDNTFNLNWCTCQPMYWKPAGTHVFTELINKFWGQPDVEAEIMKKKCLMVSGQTAIHLKKITKRGIKGLRWILKLFWVPCFYMFNSFLCTSALVCANHQTLQNNNVFDKYLQHSYDWSFNKTSQKALKIVYFGFKSFWL